MRNVMRRVGVCLLAGAIATTAILTTAGSAAAATAAPTALAARTATTLSWPIVSQGARGERVFAIQYLLNQQIGAGLALDGIFGPATAAAVRAFQKKVKVSADGQVGPITWTKLIITVKTGSKGSAVSAVQHNLRFSYGFTSLAVDGIFGPKTDAAVRDFQAKFKLAVDGIVGLDTWNSLIVHEN